MNYNIHEEIISIGRAKDITGEVFGRLTVIGRTHNIKKETAWMCKCDCGSYKAVNTTSLRSGNTKSCGCKGNAHDIKGEGFGRLIATKPTTRRSTSGDVYWICKCDCGNATEVRKSRLSGGNTKSCGCLAKELTSKRRSESGLDLTNKRFGRLVAVRLTGDKITEGNAWYCQCDCGGTLETSARSLNGGRATSCGCKRIEHVTRLGLSNAGKNNPSYDHSLTDEQRATNRFHRASYKTKQLRVQTLERDGLICNVCGCSHEKLVAHHIESFADNIDLRFDIGNMITMCEGCHVNFHREYGYGNNTREQLNSYKSDNIDEQAKQLVLF